MKIKKEYQLIIQFTVFILITLLSFSGVSQGASDDSNSLKPFSVYNFSAQVIKGKVLSLKWVVHNRGKNKILYDVTIANMGKSPYVLASNVLHSGKYNAKELRFDLSDLPEELRSGLRDLSLAEMNFYIYLTAKGKDHQVAETTIVRNAFYDEIQRVEKSINVSGSISKNDKVELKPFRIDRLYPSKFLSKSSSEGGYSFQFKSKEGNLLDEFKFDLTFKMEQFGMNFRKVVDMDTTFFSRTMELPLLTHSIMLLKKDKVLYEFTKSPNNPELKIQVAEISEGELNIEWLASDIDDDYLEYTIFYFSHGDLSFKENLYLPLEGVPDLEGEFKHSLYEGFLPPGKDAKITIEVSDGFNVSEVTAPITVLDDVF